MPHKRRRTMMNAGPGRSAINNLLFFDELQTTVVPKRAAGSGTATFTRATTSTVEDFEGLIKPALSGEVRFKGARRVENLVTFTEDFSNAAWVASNVTKDTDTLTATAGNGTALHAYTALAGDYVFSVELKRITGTGNIQIAADSGTWTTVTLTTSFQRFSVQQTATAGAKNAGIRIVTDTDAVDVRKAQLEDVEGQAIQNPSEYVSSDVESTPFHGAMVDAVKYFLRANANTVSSNVVTEATGDVFDATDSHNDASGPHGGLFEGQRINIALRARVWENAAWVKTNVTANDDEVAGPDGRTRAASLTATAANGTVIQDLGVIASAAKVWGLWVKRKTGSGDIDLTLNNGGAWTTITVTADWTRVSITATLANPDIGIRIVTDTDAIYVDFAQAEAATFLSSTIPETAGTAVTRNADDLTYVSASNVLDVAGTISAEVSSIADVARTAIVLGFNSQQGMRTTAAAAPVTAIDDGTNTSQSPIGTDMVNAPQKLAATWGSVITAYSPGALTPDATPGAYDGAFVSTNFGVGIRADNGNELYGTVRFLKTFNRQLSDAEVVL